MKPILGAATVIIFFGFVLNIPSAEASTSFSYDKLNRLTGVTYADGTTISYTYDAVGNRTGTTRAVIPAQAVNGVCGNANGKVSDTAPIANLCVTGMASAVVGSGPWSWVCQGSNGGYSVNCGAGINYYHLSVSMKGNGNGMVTSAPAGINPVGISCASEVCSSTFPFGATIVLTATPDLVSLFYQWGGDCTPSGSTCAVTISNVAKSVTATINPAPKAMIAPDNSYATLLEAYTATQPGIDYTILALFTQNFLSAESLAINRDSAIFLKGGFKAGFQEKYNLPTVLKSPLIISSGRLTLEDVVIR